jgi:hypothetical protein
MKWNWLIKKYNLSLLFLWAVSGCVGPPDHEYGLVENFPVVINTENVFTFSLFGDKYSSEDTYQLNMVLSDSIHKVITSLIVSEYAGSNRDTTLIYIENDSTIADFFSIHANYSSPPIETDVDSVSYFPKRITFKSDQFSGKLELLMIRSDI